MGLMEYTMIIIMRYMITVYRLTQKYVNSTSRGYHDMLGWPGGWIEIHLCFFFYVSVIYITSVRNKNFLELSICNYYVKWLIFVSINIHKLSDTRRIDAKIIIISLKETETVPWHPDTCGHIDTWTSVAKVWISDPKTVLGYPGSRGHGCFDFTSQTLDIPGQSWLTWTWTLGLH